MNSPIRATSGKLTSKVNGENTLTFNMFSKYYDEESGQFFDNPFLKLLVNERKVKLKYDDKWYDFVIKDVKENSENKTWSYTCKDLFINELSKSGFNIQLDPELENNMGNVTYLAEQILEESDWRLGTDNSVITQTKEEPLYEIVLNRNITGTNMQGEDTCEIEAGETIYGFYGVVANKEPYFQFLYCGSTVEIDDKHVITNSKNYYLTGITYDDNGMPDLASEMNISSEYRGNKLIRQALTVFDSTVDKYVNVYEKDDIQYYGYTKSEYVTPTAVETFITNGESFTSEDGWEVGCDDNKTTPELSLVALPDARDIPVSQWAEQTEFRSFICFKRTNNKQTLFNSGFADHRSRIKSLAKDEEYVFRAKIGEATEYYPSTRPKTIVQTTDGSNIEVVIGEYTLSNGQYTLKENGKYFQGKLSKSSDGWLYAVDENNKFKSLVSKSYSDLINARIGIFINTPVGKNYYLENVQLFKYITYDKPILDEEDKVVGHETAIAEPGGELFSFAKTRYIYYLPNTDYKSEEDIKPEYDGYEENTQFQLVYNENDFEKVRSITASESNRFNMLQDICETFQCWVKFTIEHNEETGEILLDDEYRQKKWVTFHEYIGKDNYAGFKYGVNLKSISRTLNSDGIVSKIVVKNNANEFAPNGFCSIARAKENPTGENFIYSFDYYIQQGLISFSEVQNDFYLETTGYLGYYKKLKRLNADREEKIDEQTQLLKDISQYEANYQTYKLSVESANNELRDTYVAIKDLTGYELERLSQIYETAKNKTAEARSDEEKSVYNWFERDELITKINKVAQLQSLIAQHTILRDKEYKLVDDLPVDGNLYKAEQRYAEIEEEIKELAEQKKALNFQFYKKYSRFIQEGSWISEDYTDENLYYMDAESTLFTSAQPKVTYTINVLELSQLEGYENYSFALGDKTYIEDTEFFGWVWKNGIRTPYHEEIVVSEFTIELDSPEKNTFKVQNFKTQFEDLFQRITATTQSVEFHTGEYGRASSVVETNGTISLDTLQSSIANNSLRLENAKDQSVVWDETGITTTSLTKPSEIVRIVSGGIFASNDGGSTWRTGITAQGLNADFITAGRINTSIISIQNGDFSSFRWDGDGISAFQFQKDNEGKAYGFNTAKFVRFDQYGIYGIDGDTGFVPNGEDGIWNNDKTKYALTWKGFLLRNEDGSVQITSTNDIQVLSGIQERIKIGRIYKNEDSTIYGIRISNADGVAVMETDDRGELWLRNRLRVGTESTSTVEIGYLDATRAETNVHEVFHAGNGDQEFVVYEDGKMIAQGAEFHGGVFAEYGQIGNMTVGEVQSGIESTKGIEIIADKGTTFQIDANNEVVLNELDFRMVEKNITIKSTNDITWELSSSFEVDDWTFLAHDVQVSVPYQASMFLNNTCFLRVTVQSSEGKNYSEFITIHRVSDGKHPIMLTITSTTGGVYINGEIRAELRATVWRNGVDITSSYDEQAFVWTKYDRDGAKDLTWSDYGSVIEIDHTEVEQKATFSCELIQE